MMRVQSAVPEIPLDQEAVQEAVLSVGIKPSWFTQTFCPLTARARPWGQVSTSSIKRSGKCQLQHQQLQVQSNLEKSSLSQTECWQQGLQDEEEHNLR